MTVRSAYDVPFVIVYMQIRRVALRRSLVVRLVNAFLLANDVMVNRTAQMEATKWTAVSKVENEMP